MSSPPHKESKLIVSGNNRNNPLIFNIKSNEFLNAPSLKWSRGCSSLSNKASANKRDQQVKPKVDKAFKIVGKAEMLGGNSFTLPIQTHNTRRLKL